MCLFRKKTVADKVKDDRELIAANSKAIEALVVLAKDNSVLVNSLKDVQEKLKYLIPSDNSKVVDCDKKIKNKIDDLRIELTKSGGLSTKKIEDLVTEIMVTVADRSTKM